METNNKIRFPGSETSGFPNSSDKVAAGSSTTRFAHLHTHTHYSLLDGLSKIDDLVACVKELGMDSVAITDHGVMYGAIEFYQKAKKAGIKPIIGCEMYVTDGDMRTKRVNVDDKRYYHLILLAENNVGYKNLIKLVTTAHLEGFYYKPRIDKELLRKHSEGLIGLSACLGGEISRSLLSNNYQKAKETALEYQDILGQGNYFLEIQNHPNLDDQKFVNPKLVQLSQDTGIPLVATQDSHYLRTGDAQAHDVLLAVQTGTQVGDKDRLTLINDDFSLQSPEKMSEKFADLPEAIENSIKIADRCNVELEFGKLQLPPFPLVDGLTADESLRKLCLSGIEKRYGQMNLELSERLEYELGVIQKMGFASYFLIVQDFVNWAKSQGILVGPGRGSAAGSLISYALNITNIDPIANGLIFERFLNPERVSMPDIDIDFDDARRSEVFDYVRQKYGKDHFAQIITFGTMAARGSVRDAGRALGYPYELCDRISKLVPFNPNFGKKKGALLSAVEDVSELKQLYHTNADVKKIIDSASKLEGVARHSSTHACAVVIAPKPLNEYLPLQRGTGGEDIITQYDMHAVEDLGLLKMDFLGLSNLTTIEKALQMIQQNHGMRIDLDQIPLDDKETFKLLQAAKTTGVFQLESQGMKRYLKNLKPTSMEDIIVMISLYRPGPLDAGMVEEYIERKHGRKEVKYLHPLMEPILSSTYGIIVYQEQLMQVANAMANLTLAQGYMLIKAVGKKIRSLLEEQKSKLIDGMMANNIDNLTAQKTWDFIEPFARYGFNKSHAACYALIGYQTAYLKAHYPAEFMAALLNSDAGDVERTAFLIEECQSMGIEVLPPSINESFEKFAVVAPSKIRFGLAAIKNVGENVVRTIIAVRGSTASFKTIDDFVTRIQDKDLNKKSLESLIRAGAFDELGERTTLLYNVDNLLSHARDSRKASQNGQASLFGDAFSDVLPPLRMTSVEPASNWDKLMWEKELLGLFVSEHPMKSFQGKLNFEEGLVKIKDAGLKKGYIKIGGMVTKVQKITTKTGKPMLFSWLEDMTSKIEVVVFPNILEKYPDAWQENNVVVLKGKLDQKDGIAKFMCDEVKPIAMMASATPLVVAQ